MKKVGELITKDMHFVICYNEEVKRNPYRVYNKWYYKGWHKKLLVAYSDLYSCVVALHDYMKNNYE